MDYQEEARSWKETEDEAVTIIIAAYSRPKALNNALLSIYRQTYKNWQVLIVADHCKPEFKQQIDLSNTKVSYVNLPVRCGNQYGPNSVGIELANTKYIAFLNHDDLWLEDHLETAIKTLREESCDFFLGKAAFCHATNQQVNMLEKKRIMFSELNQPEAIWRCLNGPNCFFEPASSWVIKNKFAKKIGYWTRPDQVKAGMTPVMDWIQRAAKAKTKFGFSSKVTVLKLNLNRLVDSEQPLYSSDAAEQYLNYFKQYLELSSDKVREFIKQDLTEALERGLRVRKALQQSIMINPHPREQKFKQDFQEFIKTGIYTSKLSKDDNSHGTFALNVLTKRTGEKINKFIEPKEVIARLRYQGIL